jgi:hypothetical protein
VATVFFRDLQQAKRRKRETKPRAKREDVNYRDTVWFRMLLKADISDPESRTGKLFRRRFRLPYALFQDHLAELRSDSGMEWESRDATGLVGRVVPLELKVLGALRIMGRSWVFDDVSEVTGMGETTMRVFFEKWTK